MTLWRVWLPQVTRNLSSFLRSWGTCVSGAAEGCFLRWVSTLFPKAQPNSIYGGYWSPSDHQCIPIIQLLSISDTQAGRWSEILLPRDLGPGPSIFKLTSQSYSPPEWLRSLSCHKWETLLSKQWSNSLFVSFHLIKKYSWESSICQHSKSIPSPWGLRWLLTVLNDSFWLNLGPNKTLLILDHLTKTLACYCSLL